MKHSFYFLVICIVFSGSVLALNSEQINLVRGRTQSNTTELSTSEKEVVAQFWTTALDEMLLAGTSQDAVAIRKELVKQKGIERLSNYRSVYVQEALKGIETALLNLERLDNQQQRIMVKRNLMILTANLESPKLSEIALGHLADEDDVIRYWAVKAVTQPALIQQLSSDTITGDTVASGILEGLSKRASVEKQPEILEMITGFCMGFNDDPIARQILSQLIDQRIQAYQKWQPVQVGLDIRLLTAAGSIAALQQDAAIKSTFGRKFAELYALVIQRLMKGIDSLSLEQTDRVLTVIAEVDQKVLGETIGIRTGINTALRAAVQKNISSLNREYELLFGDRLRQGELSIRFKFDYGRDAGGNSITSPPELNPMPEK